MQKCLKSSSKQTVRVKESEITNFKLKIQVQKGSFIDKIWPFVELSRKMQSEKSSDRVGLKDSPPISSYHATS